MCRSYMIICGLEQALVRQLCNRNCTSIFIHFPNIILDGIDDLMQSPCFSRYKGNPRLGSCEAILNKGKQNVNTS